MGHSAEGDKSNNLSILNKGITEIAVQHLQTANCTYKLTNPAGRSVGPL